MDFPTTSIEDHVYTFWVHGYILLEKEGNYSLELQDYARCWLLVYLYKRLLGRGSLICLNLFKIRSWAGNVVGENQLTNLFLLPVNIFVSWEALWIIPKMQGWPSPFQIWGSSLMQKFVLTLGKCSVIYSSAAEALDGGVDQLTSKMEQTSIWKGNH